MTKKPTSAAVQLAPRKNSDKWQKRKDCFVFKKLATVPSLGSVSFVQLLKLIYNFLRFYREIGK